MREGNAGSTGPSGAPGPRRPTPRRYEDEPTGAVPVERKPGSLSPGLRTALVVVGVVLLATVASALFGFFVLADRADAVAPVEAQPVTGPARAAEDRLAALAAVVVSRHPPPCLSPVAREDGESTVDVAI